MAVNDENSEEIRCLLHAYLVQYHQKDIVLILEELDPADHYAVVINALTLFECSVMVGDLLLSQPVQMLNLFDESLQSASREILSTMKGSSIASVKRNVHARITGLPVCPEITRDTIPKNADIGRFLLISGTVIRTGPVKMLDLQKDFFCNQCKSVFAVEADFEQYYTACRPTRCPNIKNCNNTAQFTCLSEKGAAPAKCHNYQEIKIQEQVQRLSVGTIPRSIWIILLDDIVDGCKAGDDICVTGIVRRRWRPLSGDSKCDVELVLYANHLQVTNNQKTNILVTKELQEEFSEFWNSRKSCPISARNEILASICPQIYGLFVVKLAVALVLVGGVQRVDESGTKVRGESHVLLVGDPGTGKSQFLKYACKVMPRSVLTTGIGSTSAGLTVTAVKDSGEWQLEAGALVLADGGICCIDEFNSIREQDRASIHEAMEQQTISVAKAGLVCKLNSRCTILAATNPKGQYDPSQPLSVNVALASPLLSRFDLVLVLRDSRNEEWDRVISSYILSGKLLPEEQRQTSLWSMDRIRSYLCFVRSLCPVLTDDATRVLVAYYKAQRQTDDRNVARTTMRLLESIIRLSQAHAKLMFRRTVTVQDAVVAVSLMEASLQSAVLLTGVNALHTSFPDDPESDYTSQAKNILTRLGLEDLLEPEKTQTAVNVPIQNGDTSCLLFNSQGVGRSNTQHDLFGDVAEKNVIEKDVTLLKSQDMFSKKNATLDCNDVDKSLDDSAKSIYKEVTTNGNMGFSCNSQQFSKSDNRSQCTRSNSTSSQDFFISKNSIGLCQYSSAKSIENKSVNMCNQYQKSSHLSNEKVLELDRIEDDAEHAKRTKRARLATFRFTQNKQTNDCLKDRNVSMGNAMSGTVSTEDVKSNEQLASESFLFERSRDSSAAALESLKHKFNEGASVISRTLNHKTISKLNKFAYRTSDFQKNTGSSIENSVESSFVGTSLNVGLSSGENKGVLKVDKCQAFPICKNVLNIFAGDSDLKDEDLELDSWTKIIEKKK